MSSDIVFEKLKPLPPNESLESYSKEHEVRVAQAQVAFENSVRELKSDGEIDPKVRIYGDAERRLAAVEVEGLFIEAFKSLGFHEALSMKILGEYARHVQVSKDIDNEAKNK